MPRALTKMLLALILTTSLTNCAADSAGNECTWVKQIWPDVAFDQRWTETEQRQVAAHNRKVREFCR